MDSLFRFLSLIAGTAATLISLYAYIPQIRHLMKEHCSDGISSPTYKLWIFSSLLYLLHAAQIKAPIFISLSIGNLLALAAILLLIRKYRRCVCESHVRERALNAVKN